MCAHTDLSIRIEYTAGYWRRLNFIHECQSELHVISQKDMHVSMNVTSMYSWIWAKISLYMSVNMNFR